MWTCTLTAPPLRRRSPRDVNRPRAPAQARIKTQVALARALWRWIARNAAYPEAEPSAVQSVTAPLFRQPGGEDLEDALLYGAEGTWAERLALLYVALAKACELEAVAIEGFWRSEASWPGDAIAAHNHCWNAVKVTGRWRLLDCTEATLAHGHSSFYTDPLHFGVTHHPLNAPWSLRRDYIDNATFFAQPWARCSFFNAGCRVLTPGLAGLQRLPPPPPGGSIPVMRMSLAVPCSLRCASTRARGAQASQSTCLRRCRLP